MTVPTSADTSPPPSTWWPRRPPWVRRARRPRAAVRAQHECAYPCPSPDLPERPAGHAVSASSPPGDVTAMGTGPRRSGRATRSAGQGPEERHHGTVPAVHVEVPRLGVQRPGELHELDELRFRV